MPAKGKHPAPRRANSYARKWTTFVKASTVREAPSRPLPLACQKRAARVSNCNPLKAASHARRLSATIVAARVAQRGSPRLRDRERHVRRSSVKGTLRLRMPPCPDRQSRQPAAVASAQLDYFECPADPPGITGPAYFLLKALPMPGRRDTAPRAIIVFPGSTR
jgi:hypothetical protein